MKYCRQCDLGFCLKHEDKHDDTLGHPPMEEHPDVFCCICMGIYKPDVTPEEPQ